MARRVPVTTKMPAQTRARAELSAARSGRTLSAWLARAAEEAITHQAEAERRTASDAETP